MGQTVQTDTLWDGGERVGGEFSCHHGPQVMVTTGFLEKVTEALNKSDM